MRNSSVKTTNTIFVLKFKRQTCFVSFDSCHLLFSVFGIFVCLSVCLFVYFPSDSNESTSVCSSQKILVSFDQVYVAQKMFELVSFLKIGQIECRSEFNFCFVLFLL